VAGEKDWARALAERLERELARTTPLIGVRPAQKLLYANEVMSYKAGTLVPQSVRPSPYETDVLLFDIADEQSWTPRVVIETKLGSVTTHDALTYSTKAWTHRHVHPYLRYGVLIGDFGGPLPGRLARHGQHFDFMMVWRGSEPSADEWSTLLGVLKVEIDTSRRLQALLTDRTSGRERLQLLHRRLEFVPAAAPAGAGTS